MSLDRMSNELSALLQGIREVLEQQGSQQRGLLEGIQNALKKQDKHTTKLILLTSVTVVAAIITSVVGVLAILQSIHTDVHRSS